MIIVKVIAVVIPVRERLKTYFSPTIILTMDSTKYMCTLYITALHWTIVLSPESLMIVSISITINTTSYDIAIIIIPISCRIWVLDSIGKGARNNNKISGINSGLLIAIVAMVTGPKKGSQRSKTGRKIPNDRTSNILLYFSFHSVNAPVCA